MKNKKNNTDPKVFVMTRPPEGGDMLVIQTDEQAKHSSELEELYTICFYDYFLNLSKILTVKQHTLLISTLTAPIAYQFYLSDPARCQALIKFAMSDLSKQKNAVTLIKALKNMPDEVSQMDYIVRNNLSVFFTDLKQKGLEKALINHQLFYSDLESMFFQLPACFCFGIIDAVTQINPKLRVL